MAATAEAAVFMPEAVEVVVSLVEAEAVALHAVAARDLPLVAAAQVLLLAALRPVSRRHQALAAVRSQETVTAADNDGPVVAMVVAVMVRASALPRVSLLAATTADIRITATTTTTMTVTHIRRLTAMTPLL